MKGWRVVWLGASLAWMLLSGFFFLVGALQGYLQSSVLGVPVYYNSEPVLDLWRSETGKIMAHSKLRGGSVDWRLTPRDFAEKMDPSRGESAILESQSAWLARHPGWIVEIKDQEIDSGQALSEINDRYGHYLHAVPKVWLVSTGLFLLPPVIAYVLMLLISRLGIWANLGFKPD